MDRRVVEWTPDEMTDKQQVDEMIGQGIVITELTRTPTSGEISTEKAVSGVEIKQIIQEFMPSVQLDEDVSEVLQDLADNFIDQLLNYSSLMAKNRRSNTLQVEDVIFSLEKRWNMVIPGFSSGGPSLKEMPEPTDEHLKRMSLKRKAIRKFRQK